MVLLFFISSGRWQICSGRMSLTSVGLQPAQSAGADADGVVAILEEYICHPPSVRPELQTCGGAGFFAAVVIRSHIIPY